MTRKRLGALRLGGALLALGLVATACSSTPSGTPAKSGGKPAELASNVQTITLAAARAYTPKAQNGGTDDYHCTLINPHLTSDKMIVASQFFPGSAEVHHAILFLIPPDLASEAQTMNAGGKGWTCFGETVLPDTSINVPGEANDVRNHISGTPWLSGWAPGQKLIDTPKGTGALFPAGSLVVMQIHYNLLVGNQPDTPKLELQVVPASGSTLEPLQLDLIPSPPEIPCPSDVHGPLCSRSAELVSVGKRFGESQVGFVNLLEQVCGHNPNDPPIGDTTTCTWTMYHSGYVMRAVAHMHLLGVGMKIVLNPGTSQARTLLDTTTYDFNNQRFYNVTPPAPFSAGDKVQITCTYNPKLGQELPLLRKVAPHFVTWGDGSSDEMCLGIVESVANLPS